MIIVLVVFLLVFVAAVLSLTFGLSYIKLRQRKHIRSLLKTAEAAPQETASVELLLPADEEGRLKTLLKRFRLIERLDLYLEQTGKNWSSSNVIMLSLGAAIAGSLLGLKLPLVHDPEAGATFGALLGASLPFLMVRRQRAKNLAAFEKQFPEALDFLARSMRAGHAFSIALDMLSQDAPDPLGSAFRRVSNDMQLGSSLEASLKRLSTLMPLIDVRFFVSSVLLQQETGGNLGEILSKLAYVIRERFRVKGEVKAASAHGRITGLVLLLMPLAVTGLLMLISPQYLTQLWTDPGGRLMVYFAIAGQIVGYFVIKKIVNIKV